MLVKSIPLGQIRTGERTRKEIRNVDSLAESISRRGLLQPVVVRSVEGQYCLVAGGRRIEAVRRLGMTEIEAHVTESLGDELEALLAEGEENTEREPFTPSEAVAHAERIEQIERRRAEERRAEAALKASVRAAELRRAEVDERQESLFMAPAIPSVKFTEGTQPDAPRSPRDRAAGESRNRIATAVGMSAPTLAKAKRVVEAANDPATPEPVREEARIAQRQMDESGQVHGAYKRLELAKEKHAIDQARKAAAADTAPVDDYLVHDMEMQRKAAVAGFMKALPRTAALAAFVPEEIALVLDEDCMTALRSLHKFVTEYRDRIEEIRAAHAGR